MKTYVAFVRDHSGSMGSIRNEAQNDYNLILTGLKKEVNAAHEIYGSVTGCGVGWSGDVRLLEGLKPVQNMQLLTSYDATGGGTPLWDAVYTAINSLNKDSFNNSGLIEQEAYLVIVTTDGHNNAGHVTSQQLRQRIIELQRTDKWTFVFRVPKGDKQNIINLGIPEGNVVEWEQTSKGVQKLSEITESAIPQYFTARSKGITSSTNFYNTDLSKVSLIEIKKNLTDISNEIHVIRVWSKDAGSQIRDFCNDYFGEYKLGSAFYQLNKKETIQPHKKLIIKHLKSGKYYGGSDARSILNLPDSTNITVKPGDHGEYEIYVQSTSVNRKLIKDTNVIYWKNA